MRCRLTRGCAAPRTVILAAGSTHDWHHARRAKQSNPSPEKAWRDRTHSVGQVRLRTCARPHARPRPWPPAELTPSTRAGGFRQDEGWADVAVAATASPRTSHRSLRIALPSTSSKIGSADASCAPRTARNVPRPPHGPCPPPLRTPRRPTARPHTPPRPCRRVVVPRGPQRPPRSLTAVRPPPGGPLQATLQGPPVWMVLLEEHVADGAPRRGRRRVRGAPVGEWTRPGVGAGTRAGALGAGGGAGPPVRRRRESRRAAIRAAAATAATASAAVATAAAPPHGVLEGQDPHVALHATHAEQVRTPSAKRFAVALRPSGTAEPPRKNAAQRPGPPVLPAAGRGRADASGACARRPLPGTVVPGTTTRAATPPAPPLPGCGKRWRARVRGCRPSARLHRRRRRARRASRARLCPGATHPRVRANQDDGAKS